MIPQAFLKSGNLDAGRMGALLERKCCRNAGGLSGRHARRDFFGGFMDDAIHRDAASCYDLFVRSGKRARYGIR